MSTENRLWPFAAVGAAGSVLCAAAAYAAAHQIEARVAIDNFVFERASTTVPIGTTVIWENHDDIPHTIVATLGEFHSQPLNTDDKFSFTFNAPGTFAYFCSLHPHMTGEVIVAR